MIDHTKYECILDNEYIHCAIGFDYNTYLEYDRKYNGNGTILRYDELLELDQYE